MVVYFLRRFLVLATGHAEDDGVLKLIHLFRNSHFVRMPSFI